MTGQKQTSGDNSTNVQAGGSVTIYQGISYSDAREIALEVFRGNFLQLAGEAKEVARQRAEEITEAFLERLKAENQEGLVQAREPDFQHALFTVQKEYARCGDRELGDLLVDLLVDRTKHGSRSIIQIVLNESLVVAPKLTRDQLAALSVVFLFRYTANKGFRNFADFAAYLDRYVQPFADLLEKRPPCFQHLEYSGCGTMSIGSISLTQIFRKNYPGLFSSGFDDAQYAARGLSIPFTHPLLIPCLNDPTKKQVAALDEAGLRELAVTHGVSEEDIKKLITLQEAHVHGEERVREMIVSQRPYMERVYDVWNEVLCHFSLTSVGIAIGHANIKKSVGEFTNLAIWIN